MEESIEDESDSMNIYIRILGKTKTTYQKLIFDKKK